MYVAALSTHEVFRKLTVRDKNLVHAVEDSNVGIVTSSSDSRVNFSSWKAKSLKTNYNILLLNICEESWFKSRENEGRENWQGFFFFFFFFSSPKGIS